MTTGIDMSKLIKESAKDAENKTAWVEFQRGIQFQMSFVPRGAIRKMVDDCTVHKYDPTTKTREPQIDNKRFLTALCKRAVKDWKNVTPASLSKIVPVDLTELPEEAHEEELPFDIKTVITLAEEGYDFDTFIKDVAMDASYFNSVTEEELKNSETSQSGS